MDEFFVFFPYAAWCDFDLNLRSRKFEFLTFEYNPLETEFLGFLKRKYLTSDFVDIQHVNLFFRKL